MTKYPATLTWQRAKYLGVGFDMNNLKGESGHYEVDTPTNGPGTGVWFVTVHKSGVDGKVDHRASKKGGNDQVYSRSWNGSTWTTWAKHGAPNVTVTAKTTDATLTAAEILGGILTVNQGAGATSTLTLPTGALMDAAFLARYPGAAVGDTFDFALINISTTDADDALLAVGDGFTIVGDASVPAKSATGSLNTSSLWRCRRAAADTWVAYRIG